MYLWVPSYKYKLRSTYGYLRTIISSVVPMGTSVVRVTPTGDLDKLSAIGTSISFVTPTGDLNKYKSAISTSISSVTPMGDLNKYKSAISTNMCINLLYEFMKNYDICYCIYVTVICSL